MQKIEDLYSFFALLEHGQKELFFAHAKPVSIPAQTMLFWQGDVCKQILYLEDGTVKVYIQNEDGDVITLYTLQKGEQCVINTSSTISSTPALANAITISPVQGYLLDVEDVKKLMKTSDVYQEYMFSLFSLKLTSLASLIEDIRFKPLKDRIYKYLKTKSSDTCFMTHQDIADALGTSRVVVSRVLKTLENEEKIELHRGMIKVF